MRRSVVLLAGLVLLVGCVAAPAGSQGTSATADPPAQEIVLSDDQLEGLIEALPQRTPKPLTAPRLAEGLVPPTNRWYSGLVFGDDPRPVFGLPLSFALVEDGFGFGLPMVTATPDTIAGGHAADVVVGVGAARAVVATDDPSVVGIDLLASDGATLGRATIAQGSPFVWWRAEVPGTVRIPEGFAPEGEGLFVATLDGTRYALATSGAQLDGAGVAVEAGGTLTFWPVPEGHEPAELAGYAQPVTGSTLDYRVAADQVSTTLGYTGADTVIARLPQHGTGADCGLGTYPSLYGTLTLCAGPLSWTVPRVEAAGSLDLDGLSPALREELATQLESDLAAPFPFPADTYFGGKALQRTAMLLGVADQLGLTERADELARILDEQLGLWTEPQGCLERAERCFVYDPQGRGVVGLATSFGSEEYNDHHFHYGYFLYAAAVLAEHDPTAAQRHAPVMNLLAADIAGAGNRYFPDRRVFDLWAGHSWASGTSPFGDGNNQESVSEAVNAWAGLALWARVIGDGALTTEADWLLALEADASRTRWLEPDLSAFPGYTHRTTVLNWGGKRDYATWFSPEPAAKLGILLLPMSPSSIYLAGSPDAIRATVADAVGSNVDQPFGDYILMYAALAGADDRERAVGAARGLSDASIDDGMSRTYLLAWLFSLRF